LTLNRRLAPNVYLEVVPIGEKNGLLSIGAQPAREYAVKMHQFSPQAQLDEQLKRGDLSTEQIDELSLSIASFHQSIEVSGDSDPFGTPKMIWLPVEENFKQIRAIVTDKQALNRLEALEQWSKTEFACLKPLFIERKQNGFIRDCHGDMHLANITVVDCKITLFDCIEFNETFRRIDVISDIAFTMMDLIDKGKPDYAARLLDQYLQYTGDYQGVRLLPFYLVYRAMVRAKVAAIRGKQEGASEATQHQATTDYSDYTQLALRFTQQKKGILFVANGVSGSGKTTLTQPLLEKYNLIRLRSDVERKRLFGYHSQDNTNGAIYGPNASAQTYDYLLDTASTLCRSGFPVIVDATFLKRSQRQAFKNLASQTNIPFVILHFHAQESLLRKWITERAAIGRDASEATVEVLNKQLQDLEPVKNDEADYVFSIDTGTDNATAQLMSLVTPVMEKLSRKLTESA
ncbi:AAA family ATPase, partial [Pseudomonadota bacterium]